MRRLEKITGKERKTRLRGKRAMVILTLGVERRQRLLALRGGRVDSERLEEVVNG